MNMKNIIYTDGSSRGNPGPGGWGAIIIKSDSIKELGDKENSTTNNRMELTSAIKALEEYNSKDSVVLYSDSEYLIKGMTEWIKSWQRKNWKNSQKKEVMNRDLWERLLEVSNGKDIEWKHIRGHADTPGNNRCDEIATGLALEENPRLFSGKVKDYPFTDIVKSVLE